MIKIITHPWLGFRHLDLDLAGFQGGDLLARKSIFPNSRFWLSCGLLKNVPDWIYSFIMLEMTIKVVAY